MKRNTIIFAVVFFLIVIVTAQVITSNIDVEIYKNKAQRDKLAEYKITTPEIHGIIQTGDSCEFTMFQNITAENDTYIIYNLGRHRFDCSEMTETEKLDKHLEIADEWLDDYYSVLVEREERSRTIITNKTTITIKEQKR